MRKKWMKVLAGGLALSLAIPMLGVTAAPKAPKEMKAVFVPYINGNEVKDMSKLDTQGMSVDLTYFDYFHNYDEKKVKALMGEDGRLSCQLPFKMQGVEFDYPDDNSHPYNKYGYRLKSIALKWTEGNPPVFHGLKYNGMGELYTVDTGKEESVMAANFQLKYDLHIHMEELSPKLNVEDIEFKLKDHNGEETSIKTEVIDKDTVALKDVEYDTAGTTIYLTKPYDLKLRKDEKDSHLTAKETEQNAFEVTPDFHDATYEDGKNPVITTNFNAGEEKKSEPLPIPEKALRKAIYEKNLEMFNHLPNDTYEWDEVKEEYNQDRVKREAYIYEDQLEYIKDLDISVPEGESWDLAGIELLKNIKLLKIRGAKPSEIDLGAYPSLEYLDLCNMGYEDLDISQIKTLKSVKVDNNNLKSLQLLDSEVLTYISAKENHLNKGIDFSKALNIEEIYLDGQSSRLESVDVSMLKNLKSLSIDGHDLKEIDLSKNRELEFFSANNNESDKAGLEKIDLSQNKKLAGLHLKENKLQELALGDLHLSGLNLHGNQIKILDLSKVKFNTDFSYCDIIQRIEVVGEKTEQGIAVDMKEIVGKENLNKVKLQGVAAYSKETGILVLEKDKSAFSYYYNTENEKPGFANMQVDVTVKVDSTEPEKPVEPEDPAEPEKPVVDEGKMEIKSLDKALKGYKKGEYEVYDISFVDSTGKKLPVTEEKTVTVELKKVPGKNLRIFHEKQDGMLEEIKVEKVDGKKVTFKSRSFSPFYFVYGKEAGSKKPQNSGNKNEQGNTSDTNGRSPKTGDGNTVQWAWMLVLSAGFAVAMKKSESWNK